MKSFFRKLAWLTQRQAKEVELEEELQFHLQKLFEQEVAKG